MNPPLLELRSVGLSYREREVLEGVDLRLDRGELVCLAGPNGAGKSTLLRCVTGTEPGRRGAVLLGGVPADELGRAELAHRIAVVPGDASLPFAMRVEDVVALGRIPHEHPLLGPRHADRAAVQRAIERVGISHLVGRDARELSLGERQLVALAMTLAQGAGILLLDEPTVHLDLRHQVDVMTLLADLAANDGVTVLAVLHDLTLAAHFFPRLLLLDGGRLVADGPPHVVLTPDRVRDVFRVDPAFVPLVAPR